MADVEHDRAEPAILGYHGESVSLPIHQALEKLPTKQVKEIHSTDSDTLSSGARPKANLSSWRPSIARVGPLAGLGALLFAFLQIFASYAILKVSDRDPITSWKYQPQVYLAILVAFSNKAVAFALVQGVAVTFWLRALKGTTIGQLHRDWAFGLHTYKALMAGKHFNALALACICATFVAMDGPLLQRASTVRQRVPTDPQLLDVKILPEVPAYSTGVVDYASLPVGEEMTYAHRFYAVYEAFQRDWPIVGGLNGCDGTCKAVVNAPVLALDYCVSSLEYEDFRKPLNSTETTWFAEGCSSEMPAKSVFRTQLMLYPGPVEHLNLTTYISDSQVTETCSGYVNVTSCIYSSAIGEYAISVQNDTISFIEVPSSPKIIARANNTAVTAQTAKEDDVRIHGPIYRTTLAGIGYLGFINFVWDQKMVRIPDGPVLPALWPNPGPSIVKYITNFDAWGKTECAPAWKDPRNDIVAGLNELMFRTGVQFAQLPEINNPTYLAERLDPNLKVNYTISAKRLDEVTVYVSDFNYFAGAATVELFTILIVLYTFYGWWRLGRNASLSPLETAKAFDAPLLAHAPSNSNGKEIARLEDARRLQYGALVDQTGVGESNGESMEKLVMEHPQRIQKPVGRRVGLNEIVSEKLHALQRRREDV